jgi:hypothetical protein
MWGCRPTAVGSHMSPNLPLMADEPSTGRAYNRLSTVLSEFLIKNSGEPVTPLSLLLGAVRGCSSDSGAEAKRVPDGVSGRPTGTPGTEKAARRLGFGGSRISEPKPAKLADRRRPRLVSRDVGKSPENWTLNPGIRTGCLRSTNISFDSLFYNVDLISKINDSLPLKANGSIEIFIGTGLSKGRFPYF